MLVGKKTMHANEHTAISEQYNHVHDFYSLCGHISDPSAQN